MKAFMDKEFMLQSPTAQHLYHAYAEDMPICDYHCHIPPREIYENRRFDNIAQVWLGGRNPDGSYFGDHYKWRVMRSNGVPEEYITGDKPDRERFQKFAEALPMAIGNPMYHWTNLELHTFFGASVQTVKYIVDKGLIGKPLSCRASISRDYGIYAEFLTHLAKKGAGIGFDMGGYYLTALAAILGPVRSVAAFTATNDPDRVNTRIGAPGFGQAYDVQVPNVISATMQYANGVLGTLHMNSDCIEDEETCLKIYGTEGILTMGDPNQFGAPVYLQKPLCEPVEFPFTHGYQENSRGLGAAEMAWSILAGRDHRASKEMAYHVFETMHGIMTSAETGSFCQLQSAFQTPAALPAGYRSVGDWSRKEESALI